MTILFDSGNSKLHTALWDGKSLSATFTWDYPEKKEDLIILIKKIIGDKTFESAGLCSVNNNWKNELEKELLDIFGKKLRVFKKASELGINVNYYEPDRVGIDRVLAAIAAYRYFNDACVVVDMGTAVKVDAVTSEGNFIGCFIFPGIRTLTWALSERTSLPNIEIDKLTMDSGDDTESCIAGALSVGFIASFKELVRIASEKAGNTSNVIITGGESEIMKNSENIDYVFRPNLVLEGMGYMCK